MTESGLPVIGSVGDVELEPEDFAPGAVIKGSPRMMSRDLHVSEDERVFSGIWSVTPGTFRPSGGFICLWHLSATAKCGSPSNL